MQVIDQINGSALFAQSAYSAAVATKDDLGRDITATYLTAHQPLEGYATEDWVTAQGYITGVDLSPYYTTAEANSLSSMLSGAIDYVSANAGDDFPQSADEAIQTYQQNSGTYLTEHQDISYKLDTSSFTAWSAAQAENDYQLSAGAGIDLVDDDINKITRIDVTGDFGNPEVEAYVQNNSATIDDVNTSYQTNSSTFLTAHQSLEGLMSASLLEFNAENNISAYNGSAFEDCAPTLPMTGRDGVDVQLDNGTLVLSSTLYETVTTNSAQWSQGGAGDEDVNNYVYNNSASISETVTAYEQNSASYLTAVPTGYALESSFEKNADDKITAYNGTAFFAGGEGGGDMYTAYLEYNSQNQISGYAGSAFAGQGGGGNPEVENYVQTNSANIDETVTSFQTNSSTYMVEPNLEYNSQGYINGYAGSAVATIDQERQWFTHDSTLTHLSNSSQYALGVNMSAISADLARMMGVDETVLYSAAAGNENTFTLNETPMNFNEIKVYTRATNWGESTVNRGGNNYFFPIEQFKLNRIGMLGQMMGGTSTGNQYFVGAYYSGTSSTTWTKYLGYVKAVNTTANADWANSGHMAIYKVIGVGRKEI